MSCQNSDYWTLGFSIASSLCDMDSHYNWLSDNLDGTMTDDLTTSVWITWSVDGRKKMRFKFICFPTVSKEKDIITQIRPVKRKHLYSMDLKTTWNMALLMDPFAILLKIGQDLIKPQGVTKPSIFVENGLKIWWIHLVYPLQFCKKNSWNLIKPQG